MIAYQCKRCEWTGFNPSLSDASDLIVVDGEWVMDRTHVPVCPKCFADVVTVREAQARELRRALIGIALVQ